MTYKNALVIFWLPHSKGGNKTQSDYNQIVNQDILTLKDWLFESGMKIEHLVEVGTVYLRDRVLRRAIPMSYYLSSLSNAIAAMHTCTCSHFGTQHVRETHNGETLGGNVEKFQLDGHPDANVAYGWGWYAGEGGVQCIGILNVPSLSPQPMR